MKICMGAILFKEEKGMFYRRGVAALLSLGMVLSMGMTAFASTNKEYTEIKSVKFSLKFDGFDEYGFPQFTGNSSSSNYVLNDVYRYTTSQDPDWGDAYEAKEDTHDNWWEEDYDPFLYEEEQEKLVTESEDYLDTIEIPLNYYFYDREKHPITSEVYVAEFRCDENNYKFNVKTDKVTLKNADAKIHSCALEENSSILKVKFTLNNENAYVGNVEEESVSLDDNYTLTWKPAALAQRYKLRIYGSSYSQLEILTDTLSYSLRGLATKAGNYKIKLYALDAAGNATKEYAEVTMSVSDESAALVNTEFAAVPYGWYSEVKKCSSYR